MSGYVVGLAFATKCPSPAAKLVLVKLADNADQKTGICWPSVGTIAEACDLSRRRVVDVLRQLEELGMIRIEHRTQDGATLSNRYHLLYDRWEKRDGALRQTEDVGVVQPLQGGDAAIAREGVQPLHPNRHYEPSKNHTPPTPPRGEDDGFASFWSAYPRRDDKGHARQAWARAIKKDKPETIIAGARRYAKQRSGRDQQYTALPATWLNGERWLDQEPETISESTTFGGVEYVIRPLTIGVG